MTLKTISKENQTILYDRDLISAIDVEHSFDIEYWKNRGEVVGKAKGRGTTWFLQLASMQGALRHYLRGGLLGKLVRDSYWFTSWDSTRSLEEFKLLSWLCQQGVHVPRPIAARVIKCGFVYQADLITERIPNALDLVDILKADALSNEVYEKIGQEIAKMHHAGVNHTDLNIHNIMLDGQNKVWIIDFDKCQRKTNDNGDWKTQNLSRLKRSFVKEQQKHDIHWRLENYQVLYRAYEQSLHYLSS